MAVSSERITVGASATALNAAGTAGQTILIKNGAAVVDLGPSSVTSGTGFSVAVSGTTTVDLKAGDVLFAICATSSIVEVLRT